jgi:hypothetical protein
MKERGIRRVIWMPGTLDGLVETTKERLGLTRSGLYRYAITRLLEELNVLGTKAHEKEIH